MIRLLTGLLIGSIMSRSFAADRSPRFETHVRPILKKHCFHCHGEADDREGSLDLRLVRFMKAGGDSGPAVVPGDPDDSLLLQRIVDGEMPPDDAGHLTDEEIRIIRQWIDAGAETVRPEPESADEISLITEEERAHWAFQPIRRPSVPQVQSSDRVSSPVDAFLLARLEAAGFSFQDPARPAARVRRLFFDLHGLPPEPEDVQAFERQPDDTAWSALIDRLLQSPRYGERWARHWLDVAGYADSEGYTDTDPERPDAWRYRDYVIRAFSRDKPFDEFITEQLAGDELIESPLNNLTERDVERLTATGFLRMAADGTSGSVPDPAVARNETIADTIRIVSSSLLGLTIGCAQCHNHRYDPISQEDYYRFRAIFDPALNWQKWRHPGQRRVSMYRDADRQAAALVEAEAKKLEQERAARQAQFIASTFEKQLAKLPTEMHEAARAAHKTPPDQRTDEQKALFRRYPQLNVTAGSLYLYDQKAADELKAMSRQIADIRGRRPPEGFIRALTEIPGQVPVSHVFARGDHEQPRQEVVPGEPQILAEIPGLDDIPVNDPSLPGTGRRLALARRLTSPKHPLTARVIVNRVWLHHFGQGLVATPGDFGILGERPTHPDLLDWLASEFIDSGWSLKHLHRLILTSQAWQQQSACPDDLQQADPRNSLYGRAPVRRLDAEALRDSLLAVCGQLNTRAGGPPVPVMADLTGRIVVGRENIMGETPGPRIDLQGEERRRSIYIQVRRSRPLAVLATFDRPDMSPNCELRRPSTAAPQSLLMLNSDLMLQYSRWLADRLQTEAGDDPLHQIQRAWQLVYARLPNSDEQREARHFLEAQTAALEQQTPYQPRDDQPPKRSAAAESLALMCQMLLASNEFLYID